MSEQQPTFVGTTDIGQLEVTGTFITGVGSDKQGPYYETTEKVMIIPDHGQPIDAWARDQKGLNAEDRASVTALIGVRTVGDLLVTLERGDIPKELAGKVKRALEK